MSGAFDVLIELPYSTSSVGEPLKPFGLKVGIDQMLLSVIAEVTLKLALKLALFHLTR